MQSNLNKHALETIIYSDYRYVAQLIKGNTKIDARSSSILTLLLVNRSDNRYSLFSLFFFITLSRIRACFIQYRPLLVCDI